MQLLLKPEGLISWNHINSVPSEYKLSFKKNCRSQTRYLPPSDSSHGIWFSLRRIKFWINDGPGEATSIETLEKPD